MKFQRLKSLALAVGVGSLSILTVKAATINIYQDFDLATHPVNEGAPNTLYQNFTQVTPTMIVSGDTVNLTFNFLNGRVLMENSFAPFSEMDYVDPLMNLLGFGGSVVSISNIEISFLNAEATGGVQTHFSLGSQSPRDETWGLGPALAEFLPSGSSLSFSGIQTSYYVDFINGGSHLYNPLLLMAADNIEVIPIPEPSLLSFGSLVAVLSLFKPRASMRLKA